MLKFRPVVVQNLRFDTRAHALKPPTFGTRFTPNIPDVSVYSVMTTLLVIVVLFNFYLHTPPNISCRLQWQFLPDEHYLKG